MIVKALIELLKADLAVAALASTRIYARQAPQGVAQPFVVLQRISRTGLDTLDGPSGMARHRIQVDAYAKEEIDVVGLASAIRLKLESVAHQDVAIDTASPPATVRVQAVSLSSESDLPEEPGAPRLFRRSMDFTVVHNE